MTTFPGLLQKLHHFFSLFILVLPSQLHESGVPTFIEISWGSLATTQRDPVISPRKTRLTNAQQKHAWRHYVPAVARRGGGGVMNTAGYNAGHSLSLKPPRNEPHLKRQHVCFWTAARTEADHDSRSPPTHHPHTLGGACITPRRRSRSQRASSCF